MRGLMRFRKKLTSESLRRDLRWALDFLRNFVLVRFIFLSIIQLS
jgi:hypothetical protein